MSRSIYNKQELIDKVISMRLNDSASIKHILKYLMDEMGYSRSQSYEYLKWARDEITETYKRINESAVEESVGQLEEAMMWAKSNNNYKLWFELRKELNKIEGNYPKDKLDITSNGNEIKPIIVNIIKPNGT